MFANDNVEPSGQTLALRVVGISVIEFELPGTGPTSYDLYGTQALAESLRNRSVPYYWYLVTLRHGSAGLPQFEAQARALGALGVTDEDSFASTVSSSIRPQAVGWLALAILLALIALIAIGQALSRQAIIEADSYGALRALGATPRQLLFVGLARAIVVALVGAVGSVLLAFLLSPLSPVGEARLVDPSSGFSFDAQVLLLGGLAATVAVLALGVWPSSRTARISRPRPTSTTALSSRLVSQLSGAGVPPTVVIGVRHALERGRGRNSVPVGPALLGAVLAVTALSATAVFSSSLTHLTATPALYGQPFNAWFSAESSVGLNRAMLSNIERGRAISGITVGFSGDVSINGTVVNALVGSSIRGPVLVTAISGRDPAAADEVALGVSTLREVGAHIGSLVTVTLPTPTGSTRKASFRVVGSAVFPPDFGTGRLGAGAVFSLQGVLGSACPTGRAQTDCYSRLLQTTDGSVLVRAADTPGAEAYLARLERIYSSQLNLPVPPTDLVNFGEAVNFPLLFGVALVLFGVATLVHLLVASVSRRRRETGLLKAIGFVRQQVALAVTWQTTTIAAVGIVVGVPVGIAVGRAVWQLFAENLGVFPEIQVSTEWILAVGVGTLVVANLLAVGPAIVAARLRPANLLRSE